MRRSCILDIKLIIARVHNNYILAMNSAFFKCVLISMCHYWHGEIAYVVVQPPQPISASYH